MHVDSQIAVALLVYGLAPILILAAACFVWRRIRPHCRRYGSDPYSSRVCERKKFWGYE